MQNHPRKTYYYSISRMLERASFYGLRVLLVLYMISETLKMERTEAFVIYGWVIGLLVFAPILGALIGDLVIGNRKAIIIGGVIQALGAFSLCIPSTTGLYIGLFFIILGSGLFNPNLTARFGKLYQNKTKLLDSGFTLFYVAVNLGAPLGILSLGYIGETYGYPVGFLLSGILILLAVISFTILKNETPLNPLKIQVSVGERTLKITIIALIVGVFWSVYEISNIRFYDVQYQFGDLALFDIPKNLWSSLNYYFLIPLAIIAAIVWAHFYSTQFLKLMFGFIFGAISFTILFLVPEIVDETHIITYFTSLFFLCLAEVLIAPTINSVLTQYSNPKYLAIFISLTFLPSRLIAIIFGLFSDIFHETPALGLIFGIIIMSIFSIGLVVIVILDKKLSKEKNTVY